MPLHPLEHEAPHGAVRWHCYASTCIGVEQSELEEPCLPTCVYVLRLSSHEGRRYHVGVRVGSNALVAADELCDHLGHGQPQPRELL
tara:strand:+ start:1733 stop:1993 length:261 start_codon:yes stop_codon:yes gene_type:complete